MTRLLRKVLTIPPYHWLLVGMVMVVGCGATFDLPTPGAARCANNVYIEPGARITCPMALAFVAQAEGQTGISAGEANAIEFMAGYHLDELGNKTAWGLTSGGNVAVVATNGSSLVHEFLHLRGDSSHCHWSKLYLGLFNAAGVAGAFDDTCEHVKCSSTYGWVDSATGQIYGNAYSCVAY